MVFSGPCVFGKEDVNVDMCITPKNEHKIEVKYTKYPPQIIPNQLKS